MKSKLIFHYQYMFPRWTQCRDCQNKFWGMQIKQDNMSVCGLQKISYGNRMHTTRLNSCGCSLFDVPGLKISCDSSSKSLFSYDEISGSPSVPSPSSLLLSPTFPLSNNNLLIHEHITVFAFLFCSIRVLFIMALSCL